MNTTPMFVAVCGISDTLVWRLKFIGQKDVANAGKDGKTCYDITKSTYSGRCTIVDVFVCP